MQTDGTELGPEIDVTDLIIYTSWANSFCNSEFKRSVLRILIATS